MTQELFKDFPGDARVWLYQTDRALNENEIQHVDQKLQAFVRDWAAHGNQLWANARVINPFFVAVAVNDALTPPSGCSIDASVKEMQALGKSLDVDFFTRMKVTYIENGEIDQIDFSDLSELSKDTLIYDPLVGKLEALRSSFPSALKESSFAHMV